MRPFASCEGTKAALSFVMWRSTLRMIHTSCQTIFRCTITPANCPCRRTSLPQHPFDDGEMNIRDEQLLPWPRTEAGVCEMNAEYYRYIAYLDAQIGRVLDTWRLRRMPRTRSWCSLPIPESHAAAMA